MTEPSSEVVLQAALNAKLTDVLVIGDDAFGKLYVAAAGSVGVAEAMLFMERAKQHLLEIYETYQKEPPTHDR